MARALFIAEKPSFMREVNAVYKKRGFKDTVDFVSLSGHVVDSYKPADYNPAWGEWKAENLPMIPEVFKFKAPTESYKLGVFNKAKDMIKSGNYDYLICATDAGREGNLIFDAFYQTIGCKLPVKRFFNNDTTEDDLYNSLLHPLDYSGTRMSQLTAASYLRSYFDWLIGMNLTTAITINARHTIRVGRVKTPILKILTDRELAIRNFVSKPFWEIEATFDNYTGTYFNAEGESAVLNKADAEAIIKALAPTAVVKSVDKKRDVKYAPELFSLSFLQAEANKVYRYTLQETLEYTQSLYEKKAVSYPRTSSSHVTAALSKQFDKIVNDMKQIKEVATVAGGITAADIAKASGSKKYVDDTKVTDHYAIIPTGTMPDFSKLSPEENNIYMLIVKRFLSIFMPPLIQDKTKIITTCNGYDFSSTGSVLVSAGYTTLYASQFDNNLLPNVNQGDVVKVTGSKLVEKKTNPPTRFDDEMLIKALINAGKFIEDDDDLKAILSRDEKKGIGTEATRASIVEALIKENLIRREKARFYVNDEGISIIQTLGDIDLVTPKLTAIWEGKLIDIESGKLSASTFKKEMYDFVREQTEIMLHMKTDKLVNGGTTGNMTQSEKKVMGKCPSCGQDVIEGKDYYLCSNYKKEDGCTFIVGKSILGASIGATTLKSLLKGETTKPVKMKSPKTGKSFEAGLKYNPDTKRVDFIFESNDKTKDGSASNAKVICKCPLCEGDMTVKSGQYGEFYACTLNCGFRVSKVIGKKNITEAILKKIVKDGVTDKLDGFKKKDGSGEFGARLELNKAEKKVVFNFDR